MERDDSWTTTDYGHCMFLVSMQTYEMTPYVTELGNGHGNSIILVRCQLTSPSPLSISYVSIESVISGDQIITKKLKNKYYDHVTNRHTAGAPKRNGRGKCRPSG